MQFALPPRKASHPAIYPGRSARLPLFLRRSRLQLLIIFALGFGAILFLLSRLGGGSDSITLGSPPVVIVTVLQPELYTEQYIENVRENRNEYAKKHGYATFFPLSTDYDLNDSPASWAKVPAMRHALTIFPRGRYFWYLDQNALIMNPELTVEQHIMDTKRMEELMIKDQPVVPPDSVIKTFTHLHGNQIDFALTQDHDGLSALSFILRQGDWSKFFLDTWFDPLYRSYNFQKAETHALEHLVQWHPTVLSRLALIPQRTENSYSRSVYSESVYKDGDFVIVFEGCALGGDRNCEAEAAPFSKQWRTIFHARR